MEGHAPSWPWKECENAPIPLFSTTYALSALFPSVATELDLPSMGAFEYFGQQCA